MMSPPQLKTQTSGTASEPVLIIVVIVVAVVFYYYNHYYHHFLCDCFLFDICGNVPDSHAMLGDKNSSFLFQFMPYAKNRQKTNMEKKVLPSAANAWLL